MDEERIGEIANQIQAAVTQGQPIVHLEGPLAGYQILVTANRQGFLALSAYFLRAAVAAPAIAGSQPAPPTNELDGVYSARSTRSFCTVRREDWQDESQYRRDRERWARRSCLAVGFVNAIIAALVLALIVFCSIGWYYLVYGRK